MKWFTISNYTHLALSFTLFFLSSQRDDAAWIVNPDTVDIVLCIYFLRLKPTPSSAGLNDWEKEEKPPPHWPSHPPSLSLSLFPLDLGMRPIYLSFFLSWSRGKGKGKKLKPLRAVGLALFRERKKRKERKKWEIGKMEKYSSTSHNLAPGLAVLGLLFALSFSFYLLRKHEKSRKKKKGRRKKNRWAYCPRDSKWNLKRRTRSAAQCSPFVIEPLRGPEVTTLYSIYMFKLLRVCCCLCTQTREQSRWR